MKEILPILLLKNLVLLPCQEVRLELNNETSKKIIDLASNEFNNKLLVVCPENPLEVSPSANDLPNVGVIAKIKSKIELPNGNYRVVLSGLNRVMVFEYKNRDDDYDIFYSLIKRIYIDTANDAEELALFRTLKNIIAKYMEKNPAASNSVMNAVASISNLDMLTDVVTNYLPMDIRKKISYMNEFDYITRANNLISEINVEMEVLKLENKIEDEIHASFEKEQRDFILKSKINKLNEELGITSDKQTEVSRYHDLISNLVIDERIRKKLFDELEKYSYTSETNPDASVIRNYLDIVINLPWNRFSKDETDLRRIKKSLDKSHYGLENVKNRILEFVAIKKNNPHINAPIICLVGPPGTGKTTLGLAISNALHREFYKISVGGLNDPTELTGHKRTYLGSSPGKIIQGLRKCNTANPLILIDEVDKMVQDYKGDPSAVLLDILDTNQNRTFVDNYVEEPFDLSKVLFILTANDLKSIPEALKDRLEVIEISSYTEYEKLDIAKKYLIPNIIELYNANKVKISDEVILKIIYNYTSESGVRELERVLKKIFRYIIMKDNTLRTLTFADVVNILGLEKYNYQLVPMNHVGSVNTLAVTPFGGVVINFECIFIPGNGGVLITGNVEESIEQSVKVAISYIKNNAKKFGIDMRKFTNNDIHINALNFALKKDGTSGGLAFTTAVLSLLLDRKVAGDIAFTGEVTLHGDILKVGGIKEKVIGAYNNGFRKVYIPQENFADFAAVPDDIKQKMTVTCVSNYEEVYNDLFKKV